MKKILLNILFFLFIVNSHAQYTNIINSNRPGKTETAYAVGTDVIQFENATFSETSTINNTEVNSINNSFNLRYGILFEKLEINLTHNYSYQNNSINGTERLAIGAKFLLFDFNKGETPEKLRSWKKRYGFWQNGIYPAIAIAAHYNTPFTNNGFTNSSQGSTSLSLILQNNINQKLRINNQFNYNYIGADIPEFSYHISSTYAITDRLNPYIQFGYYNSDAYSYISPGIGVPCLINKNLAVSIYSDISLGNNITGFEFGFNASYRIDHHEDDWTYKESKLKLDKKLQDEQNIDQTLLEEELGLNVKTDQKKSLFSRVTSIFKKKKKEKTTTKKKKSGFFKNLFKKKEKKEIDDNNDDAIKDLISDY